MPVNLYLACSSVAETRDFYRDVLKFETVETEMQTVTAQYGGCSLIFFQAGEEDPAPTLTGTVYLFVPDVDGYYALVTDSSGKDKLGIEWPLQDMSYGTREFALKDCNGYRLAFAQDRHLSSQRDCNC